MMKRKDQKGFTLTELLLAMAVFSMVMMIATVGFIGMNRAYTRGAIKRGLSEAVQRINNDVTRAARSTGGVAVNGDPCDITPTGFSNSLQVAGIVYAWKVTGGMWQSSDCTGSFQNQILVDKYTVREFSITKVPTETGLYNIQGVFTAGDEDGLNVPTGGQTWYKDANCKGTAESAAVQGCAIEKFQFIVVNVGGQSP